MFKKDPTPEELELDNAIMRLLSEMDVHGPDTQEYAKMLEHLVKLNEMRNGKKIPKFSYDTVISGAFTFCGIVAIIAYEQKHVMASKAMNFFGKTKL